MALVKREGFLSSFLKVFILAEIFFTSSSSSSWLSLSVTSEGER